jgi:hypothetical protein
MLQILYGIGFFMLGVMEAATVTVSIARFPLFTGFLAGAFFTVSIYAGVLGVKTWRAGNKMSQFLLEGRELFLDLKSRAEEY